MSDGYSHHHAYSYAENSPTARAMDSEKDEVRVRYEGRIDVYQGIDPESLDDFGFWCEEVWESVYSAVNLRAVHFAIDPSDTYREISMDEYTPCDECGIDILCTDAHVYC